MKDQTTELDTNYSQLTFEDILKLKELLDEKYGPLPLIDSIDTYTFFSK